MEVKNCYYVHLYCQEPINSFGKASKGSQEESVHTVNRNLRGSDGIDRSDRRWRNSEVLTDDWGNNKNLFSFFQMPNVNINTKII